MDKMLRCLLATERLRWPQRCGPEGRAGDRRAEADRPRLRDPRTNKLLPTGCRKAALSSRAWATGASIPAPARFSRSIFRS